MSPTNIILFSALIFFMVNCNKRNKAETPSSDDYRKRFTGTYQCAYTLRNLTGTVSTTESGTQMVHVIAGSDSNQLMISAMIGQTVSISEASNNFGNTRGTGRFSNDSIYMHTYTSPAATSFTNYTGVKIN